MVGYYRQSMGYPVRNDVATVKMVLCRSLHVVHVVVQDTTSGVGGSYRIGAPPWGIALGDRFGRSPWEIALRDRLKGSHRGIASGY